MSTIPEGYKQTEVGVIPEDWSVRAVSEIGEIKTGPFGTLLKAEEYSGIDGVPLISVGEIGVGVFRVSDKTPLVPDAVVCRLPQYVLRTGDIVFGRKGAVDRSAMVSESESGWFLGSDGMAIRPANLCHSPYLACQFQRYEVQTWLLQNATGTTMASLNQEVLRRVAIPYAPLPEQRAIATALSDVDALLAKLDQLIAKKRDLKQAAMQQLLTGQTRLPGFSGAWETKQVEEFGEIVTGGTPRTDVRAYWGEGYPWITPTDISSGRDMSLSERSLTLHGLRAIRALPRNTVLVTCIASIGKNAILKTEGGCNQQINAVVPNKDNCAEFLYFLFEASKQYLLANAGTTATSIISKVTFSKLNFSVPSIQEQTAIATVLSDIDAEIAALEARCDKTRALKQGMMQELLTGRTRLV